jgi:D-hydroxyproline dehydrogenase subunit gamma
MSSVSITVNGRAVQASAGSTVAAALLNAAETEFRTSVTGAARAPLCGMGTCYECRVTIDGVGHRRACMVAVADGMVVTRDE